jgi:hypothetical protein
MSSLLLFAAACCSAQSKKPVPLTTYTDSSDGLTLQYPSVWKRVNGAYAYCPPAVFQQPDTIGQRGVLETGVPVTFGVEFTGKGNFYEKTGLEGLVFLFGMRKDVTQEACTKIARSLPEESETPGKRPEWLDPHFDYSHGGECGLNHDLDAQVFTRFVDGRCYVFEEDFEKYGGAPVGHRDLTPPEETALMRHLNGIMQSVKISSILVPKSWSTMTFRDATTGVSFEYPAVMRPLDDVGGYIPSALKQMPGITWHAKLAYAPPPDRKAEEADTDFGEIRVLFATKPTQSADACRKLATDQQRQDGPVRHLDISGVPFTKVDVSDAGLSNFLDGTLYATYNAGVCLLFETDFSGLDGYVGDLTDAQLETIEQHMDAIAMTIRFPAQP